MCVHSLSILSHFRSPSLTLLILVFPFRFDDMHSITSEKRMHWGQISCCILCREVVLFLEVQNALKLLFVTSACNWFQLARLGVKYQLLAGSQDGTFT